MFHVVDSIMGSGKTTATFNYIREHRDKRFMYVTPYLNEVERGLHELNDFREPERFGSKLTGIKHLLKHKKNIVTTHSLFSRLDARSVELIRAGGYTLVMDESYEPFEESSHSDDIDMALRAGFAEVGDDGYVRWLKQDYNGGLHDLREECETHRLVSWGRNGVYLRVTSPDVFQAFREGFILTYMFTGQQLYYYFRVSGIAWDYAYVSQQYRLTHTPAAPEMPRYGELIHILDDAKLNRIGDRETALSKAHFLRDGMALTDKLRNNMYTYGRRRVKAKSDRVMWTCYKDWREDLTYAGYKKGFVPCNTKATNEFRDKNVLAYLLNRYMNVGIKNYLNDNGANVDEDEFALSEMLQWIFRSAIRNGEEIWIYIPSRRMRGLLLSWIKEVDGSAAA